MFARAGLLGISVEAMLTGDPLDFLLRVEIVKRANDLRAEFDDSLALNIVNRFAESLERGSG